VVGNQFAPPVLVLPSHRTVRLVLTSPDVIHSFYVPAFLFKRDVIPGHVNRVDLNLDREGAFEGHCAEFCGLAHADMGFTVRSLAPAGFDSWLAGQRQAS
jgi:cytochrome c oxidase subunit 2